MNERGNDSAGGGGAPRKSVGTWNLRPFKTRDFSRSEHLTGFRERSSRRSRADRRSPTIRSNQTGFDSVSRASAVGIRPVLAQAQAQKQERGRAHARARARTRTHARGSALSTLRMSSDRDEPHHLPLRARNAPLNSQDAESAPQEISAPIICSKSFTSGWISATKHGAPMLTWRFGEGAQRR